MMGNFVSYTMNIKRIRFEFLSEKPSKHNHRYNVPLIIQQVSSRLNAERSLLRDSIRYQFQRFMAYPFILNPWSYCNLWYHRKMILLIFFCNYDTIYTEIYLSLIYYVTWLKNYCLFLHACKLLACNLHACIILACNLHVCRLLACNLIVLACNLFSIAGLQPIWHWV